MVNDFWESLTRDTLSIFVKVCFLIMLLILSICHDLVITQVKKLGSLRDRSLFMTGGGAESNEFLREIFSQPTRHAEEKFRGPLDISR